MTTAKQVYEWVKTGHWNLAQFKEWAMPQQKEPVAWVDDAGVVVVCSYKYKPVDKLYTSPPARKPLTDEEKLKIAKDVGVKVRTGAAAIKFANAIEAAHNIKENT